MPNIEDACIDDVAIDLDSASPAFDFGSHTQLEIDG